MISLTVKRQELDAKEQRIERFTITSNEPVTIEVINSRHTFAAVVFRGVGSEKSKLPVGAYDDAFVNNDWTDPSPDRNLRTDIVSRLEDAAK